MTAEGHHRLQPARARLPAIDDTGLAVRHVQRAVGGLDEIVQQMAALDRGRGDLGHLPARRELQPMQERLPFTLGRVALHLLAAGAQHVEGAARVVGFQAEHAQERRLAERRVVGGAAADLVDGHDLPLVDAADQEPARSAVVRDGFRDEVRLVQPEGDDAARGRRDEVLESGLPVRPARVVAKRLERRRHQDVGGDALLDQQAEGREGLGEAAGTREGAHLEVHDERMIGRRDPRGAIGGGEGRIDVAPGQGGGAVLVERLPGARRGVLGRPAQGSDGAEHTEPSRCEHRRPAHRAIVPSRASMGGRDVRAPTTAGPAGPGRAATAWDAAAAGT